VSPSSVGDEDEGLVAGRVKVTDKRRIDPVTGAVREPAAGSRATSEATPGAPPRVVRDPGQPPDVTDAAADEAEEDSRLGADIDTAAALVAEVTADLQRVHAEYANYRKRVERDRDLVREVAVAATLAELLPVLDDLGRAREHGELHGAFKAVGEGLEATVTRLGLERFGEVGEPFDPTQHEALTHVHREDVSAPVCFEVYQPGYRFAGRVVRPARVGVAEPAPE
jgi:molecular chaperone GrpE